MAEPFNTPMPTPRSTSPAPPHLGSTSNASYSNSPSLSSLSKTSSKPIVLHIGDPVRYNLNTYAAFSSSFEVIRPSAAERQRPEFTRALRERRWGDFSAIFRPFWGTGGEMGQWDTELIGLLPDSVRVFASAGAGFDWADTGVFGEKGIIYCNAGLAAAESVADFAVAMVISTFRHLPWCMGAATMPYNTNSQATAEATFAAAHSHVAAHSRNPRGHVLGLVGLGKIGQLAAAKLGNPAFGMKIHYYDVVRKSPGEEAKLGATFHASLAGLVGQSDCVVLCTPASPDGKPLLTREAFGAFKPGGRFVNIARGSLVDEEALADALEAGRVSAAGLDVHADEPSVSKRLLKFAGVDLAQGPTGEAKGGNPGRLMLTCHNAGGTVDTHIGFEELSMRNIMAVLGGGEAITPVNMHLLKREKGNEYSKL